MSPTWTLSDEATRVLSQFPGPVTLQPGWRLKGWAMFNLFVMLVVLALPILVYADNNGRHATPILVVGIPSSIAALGFTYVSIKILLASNLLVLDGAGLEYQVRGTPRRVSWKDADRFKVYMAREWLRFVVFEDASRKREFSRLPDTYGFTAIDLVRLLTEWRTLALKRPSRH
jgi:hypothetical protein